MRLWNRIVGLFRREKWAYVKMFTITDVMNRSAKGKVYIHCYESNNNRRRVSTSCTFPDVGQLMIDEFVRAQELYQERIVRWLDGRYDPGILRFSQVNEDDTANALKGSIE